jgi:hypothetical protein
MAIADRHRGVFNEVWVGDRIVNRNMRPQSKAIQKIKPTFTKTQSVREIL